MPKQTNKKGYPFVSKGRRVIKYTIKGKPGEINITTELKQIEGPMKPRQNVWYGVAIVNERDYIHPEAEFYVNAQFLADDIANIEITKLREVHGKSLRVKK